jgi:threonylcarbamoyladenosine tRNA methylthiotransferase MtaB
MEKKTFSLVTFGCKVNTYESEAIKEKLIQKGFVYQEELPADYVIVNTCAVTLTAEKKDMEKIRSIARNFPSVQIVVMGCFSQLHPDKLSSLLGIRGILGTSKREEIPELLEKMSSEEENLVDKNSRLFSYEELSVASFGSEYRAFVKIQDGCDNFCSYCIIPLARGKSRSRSKDEILLEIRRLAEAGYKEIVLIGIDTGSYSYQGEGLGDLIKDILKIQPASFRLRISSIEESQINEELISIMEHNQRLVPHFHIPLQSGSEKILALMKRKYNLEGFLSLTQELKKRIPLLALSTDIIVGFPSETEEDFQKTCAFASSASFMRLHVFPYSRRPYTLANAMKEQIPNSVKKDRVRKLMEVGKGLSESYLLSMEGKTLHLLVEEELGQEGNKKIFRGYTENYLDLTLKAEENLLGQVVEVKIGSQGEIISYKRQDK